MLAPSSLPLDALVTRARTAFTNATTDADLALAPFGYTSARLDALLDLVESVEAKAAAQGAEYAEQYAATGAATEALAGLDALYTRHRQLARVAHRRGTDTYRALGLDGRVPHSADALVGEAGTFYRMLQSSPALAATLAPYTVDAAALTEGRAKVEAAQTALAAQAKETGDAQRATRLRDDEAAELRAALSDFTAVAKIALSTAPQLRERLGLLERS